jgi:hypothetical protein
MSAARVLRLGHRPGGHGPSCRHEHPIDEAPARSRRAAIESTTVKVSMQCFDERTTTHRGRNVDLIDVPRILDDRHIFPHPSCEWPEDAWASSLPFARRSRACPSRWASRPACKLAFARLRPDVRIRIRIHIEAVRFHGSHAKSVVRCLFHGRAPAAVHRSSHRAHHGAPQRQSCLDEVVREIAPPGLRSCQRLKL